MARKITTQAVTAFMNGGNFKGSNTEVVTEDGYTYMYLHGNNIAIKGDTGGIAIRTCGWQSNTTKERLNAIPGVSISQKQGVWYLNGNVWNGSIINVK